MPIEYLGDIRLELCEKGANRQFMIFQLPSGRRH